MNLSKITLILSLLGILAIAFLAQNKETLTGTIESVSKSPYKTTIKLQNQETELIVFEELSLPLEKGDKISFQGKPDTYKNQKQIIISKIEKN